MPVSSDDWTTTGWCIFVTSAMGKASENSMVWIFKEQTFGPVTFFSPYN